MKHAVKHLDGYLFNLNPMIAGCYSLKGTGKPICSSHFLSMSIKLQEDMKRTQGLHWRQTVAWDNRTRVPHLIYICRT
ncbi:hypothetical protein O3M35_000947 [Rhynocoris fuscipes]|uniref:Uncharacterized protein n=1 Tax=Rhynocoris fuscipes TaxID=488301 RepID=A0AAW1DPI0_9HEMI